MTAVDHMIAPCPRWRKAFTWRQMLPSPCTAGHWWVTAGAGVLIQICVPIAALDPPVGCLRTDSRRSKPVFPTIVCAVMRLGVLLSPAIKGAGHWNAGRWWLPPHPPNSIG